MSKYLTILIPKLILFLFLIQLKTGSSLITFTHPSAISLPNNNFFVVEQDGIYVYDSDFINIVKSYPFSYSEKIQYLCQLSEVIIKFQNDYLICLINSKVHFFNAEGTRLKVTGEIIEDSNSYSYPTLAPIFIKNNFYYFVVGYLLSDSSTSTIKLKLLYYKISLSDYQCSYIGTQLDDDFESYIYRHFNFKKKV